jgi:CheY-like chemotaxis protein
METDSRPLILLVEDNTADANLIEETLAQSGLDAELLIVRDGAAAIDLLHQVDSNHSYPSPDLVLLDLNLPKVSGEEVLKRIRLVPRCAKTKVLILSSSNAASDRARALELGANAYFRKPSSLDRYMDLGPKVREMLLG